MKNVDANSAPGMVREPNYWNLIFKCMSDRDTYEFATPGNHKVLVNSYLTGREAAAIKGIMLSALKMSMNDLEQKKVDMGGLTGDVLAAQERKTLEVLIISIDGVSDNPVEKLLDLPSTEYDAVLKEIEKIKNPTTPQN